MHMEPLNTQPDRQQLSGRCMSQELSPGKSQTHGLGLSNLVPRQPQHGSPCPKPNSSMRSQEKASSGQGVSSSQSRSPKPAKSAVIARAVITTLDHERYAQKPLPSVRPPQLPEIDQIPLWDPKTLSLLERSPFHLFLIWSCGAIFTGILLAIIFYPLTYVAIFLLSLALAIPAYGLTYDLITLMLTVLERAFVTKFASKLDQNNDVDGSNTTLRTVVVEPDTAVGRSSMGAPCVEEDCAVKLPPDWLTRSNRSTGVDCETNTKVPMPRFEELDTRLAKPRARCRSNTT